MQTLLAQTLMATIHVPVILDILAMGLIVQVSGKMQYEGNKNSNWTLSEMQSFQNIKKNLQTRISHLVGGFRSHVF